jgi:peptidoglycan hydrolase-like protein with peptidoglycan-binding domain
MLITRRLGRHQQLQNASMNHPPLGRGAVGPGVAQIQDLLADLGFKLPISVKRKGADGIFGPETERVVKEFQRRTGLKPDGFVGTHTLARLEEIIIRYASALETPCPVKEAASWQLDQTAPYYQKRAAYK